MQEKIYFLLESYSNYKFNSKDVYTFIKETIYTSEELTEKEKLHFILMLDELKDSKEQ